MLNSLENLLLLSITQDSLIENQLGQIILLHEHMLRTLTKLESMISACSNGKYHPNILSYDELDITFSWIRRTYPNRFHSSPDNMIDIVKTIKVTCSSDDDSIIFFVSIPLFSEHRYDYYYLLPVPFMKENNIFTMIPDNLKRKFGLFYPKDLRANS